MTAPRGPRERRPRRRGGRGYYFERLPLAASERPFKDDLTRCDERWARLLQDQRYQDARLRTAL